MLLKHRLQHLHSNVSVASGKEDESNLNLCILMCMIC